MTDQTTDTDLDGSGKNAGQDHDLESTGEIPQSESTTDEGSDPESDPTGNGGSATTEGDTFPRAYVEELRQENGKYRQDARDAGQRADALAQRLHTALVTALGKLADPTDLPFDEAHLEDPDALAAAVDDLLTRKPHLAARKVTGDIGQGARNGGESVSLLGMLRGTN